MAFRITVSLVLIIVPTNLSIDEPYESIVKLIAMIFGL